MTLCVRMECFGRLRDFRADLKRRGYRVLYLNDHASVKDTVEAYGVPHPEVGAIVVNGRSVGFSFRLSHGDTVRVYDHELPRSPKLRPELRHARFILDAHLGKLARHLRLLGFDVLYQNNFADEAIARCSGEEGRIVLTRDLGLLKHKRIVWGYWLRSMDPDTQLSEVLKKWDLYSKIKPFKRCLLCNGRIRRVALNAVADRVPPKTMAYVHEYYQCGACGKVYWRGKHFADLTHIVNRYLTS